MTRFVILTVSLTAAFSAVAASPTLQELTSRLFTNAPIVWKATNNLPKCFWIYQRTLPRVFSAEVISNAIVLGSLQSKGFPKPSTNEFFISENKAPNYPGPTATIFNIMPGDATISYFVPNYGKGPGNDIPIDETVAKRAWGYASQFGLDRTKLIQQKVYTQRCDTEQNGQATNYVCGRGVFLSRQLDGTAFFSYDNTGAAAEGFSIEFGSRGQVREFSLRWSDMDRLKNQTTASSEEIIQCIRGTQNHSAVGGG